MGDAAGQPPDRLHLLGLPQLLLALAQGLLRLPALGNFRAQLARALLDALLELVMRPAQGVVARLDLVQHLVEGARQGGHLVGAALHGPDRVVPLHGDGPGRLGQIHDRARYDALQPGREPQHEQDAGQEHQGHRGAEASQPGAHLPQVRAQADGADRVAFQERGAEEEQVRPLEAVAGAFGRRRHKAGGGVRALVAGEDPAGRGVEVGVDDVRLGAQGGEHDVGGARVVERQGGGAVVPDDLGQGLQVVHHPGAERQDVVGHEGGAGDQEPQPAGERQDQRQLVPEGKAAQGEHASASLRSRRGPPSPRSGAAS